jgi:hypothetical protein
MLHVLWSIIVQSGASTAVLFIERFQSLTLVGQLGYGDGVFFVSAPDSVYNFSLIVYHLLAACNKLQLCDVCMMWLQLFCRKNEGSFIIMGCVMFPACSKDMTMQLCFV